MKRLWDKGEPLDERILRYTAGEDAKQYMATREATDDRTFLAGIRDQFGL